MQKCCTVPCDLLKDVNELPQEWNFQRDSESWTAECWAWVRMCTYLGFNSPPPCPSVQGLRACSLCGPARQAQRVRRAGWVWGTLEKPCPVPGGQMGGDGATPLRLLLCLPSGPGLRSLSNFPENLAVRVFQSHLIFKVGSEFIFT